MAAVKITETEKTSTLKDEASLLITQKETVDGTETESLRRIGVSDAKKVLGGGLTEAAKNALVACFEHVIWDDANGPARITALKNALGLMDVDINIPGEGSDPPGGGEEIQPDIGTDITWPGGGSNPPGMPEEIVPGV